MRVTVLGLCVLVGIGVYAVASHAQQQQRTPAPTTAAKFWTLEEQNQHQKELMTTKMTNWPFYQEDKFNTEMRNLTGKQPVLVHGKRADFMMIRDGGGTFTAGGELLEGKAGGGEGDMTGTGVKGGVSKVLKPGDVVYVPPGVPHYFSEIPDHVTEILVRWDVK
jgi:mannose-6-phosphate isomerase-like protein (cupin superfamily)